MRVRFLALLAVLAMVVAACGDSGGDTTTTDAAGDGGTTVTAGAGGVTTTTGGGDDEGDATTTTGGDNGDGGGVAAGGDVGELLERFQQSRIRATYLLDEGDDESMLTLSQDPTADPPVSAILSDEDGFQVIFSGDAMTMCDANAEQCFALPTGAGTDPSLFAGAFLSPFVSSFLAFSTADTVGFDVDTEPVEVAGRSGVCFTVTPDAFVGADFDEVRQCVDDETGAMLLFEIKEAGGDFERVLELVEFGDPLASDFEPPFPLVDVPTG